MFSTLQITQNISVKLVASTSLSLNYPLGLSSEVFALDTPLKCSHTGHPRCPNYHIQ